MNARSELELQNRQSLNVVLLVAVALRFQNVKMERSLSQRIYCEKLSLSSPRPQSLRLFATSPGFPG